MTAPEPVALTVGGSKREPKLGEKSSFSLTPWGAKVQELLHRHRVTLAAKGLGWGAEDPPR